jgi:hypothetical protein
MTDGPGASRGCAAPMGAVPGGHPELTEVASLEDIVAALADVQSLQEELGILSPHGAPATDRSMGGQTAGGPSSSSPAAQLDQPSDGGGSGESTIAGSDGGGRSAAEIAELDQALLEQPPEQWLRSEPRPVRGQLTVDTAAGSCTLQPGQPKTPCSSRPFLRSSEH